MTDKNIYLIGDIHGSEIPIRDFYDRHRHEESFLETKATIILLGDAGINYYLDDRDRKFKKKLSAYNCDFFVIRGNHEQRPSILMEENPDAWESQVYFGNNVMVEKEFQSIKYASDLAEVYLINDYKTLVLPGAYSVDKWYRLERGWQWFPQEQMSAEEMMECRRLLNLYKHKFDLVLSHTCPALFIPTDLFIRGINQSTVDKTMENFFSEIEYQLNYTSWCFGHYHAFREYPILDGQRMRMLFNSELYTLEDIMKRGASVIGKEK